MLDKKIINFDGLSRYHEKLNEVLKTKQDVISDLDDIRSGAELGSTALQNIPDSSITLDKLNQEVLDELYGYGLEIYSSVDDLPEDADQGTLATVVNYNTEEVLVENRFSVRDIYVGENPDCEPILEFKFNEITSFPEQFGDGFQAIFGRKDIPLYDYDGDYYFNEYDLYKEFIVFAFSHKDGKVGFFWNDGENGVFIYETNDDGTISINAENVSILNEHIQSIGGVVCYGCYNNETETFDDHFEFIDTFLSYVIDSHTEIVERKNNEIYFKTNEGWENYNTLNLVNNLTDGGVEKALSAEMGKVLNEKITDFISGSNIESLKFKGYVNVDTKDGVDAIYEELSLNEACFVVPSTTGGTMEDSYITWVLNQIYLCEDLYNFEPSSLVKNLSGLISGDFGELKTYFYLDKEHPYAICPDLLLLAKVKVRIKQFLELSGTVSEFILALIPDDATITACIGKVIRWSGGDFVAKYGDGLVDVGKWVENNRSSLNNVITQMSRYNDELKWVETNFSNLKSIITPKYSNILDHKYGWNQDMNWARETGIIGYTTNCEGGKPGGLDEFFTVIVFGSADEDPNYRTIVQFAYGRTGAATDRIWMRILFEAVTTGHYNNFLPWLEITSGSMSADISSIFENIDSLENSIEGLNTSINDINEIIGEVPEEQTVVGLIDGVNSNISTINEAIETISSDVNAKQDIIEDIETIRSNASKGATALQSVPAEYVTESELAGKGYSTTTYVDEKVAALVNGAPDTLDTLDELAAALKDNKDIVTVLENSITSKQDKIEDLDAIRSGSVFNVVYEETTWDELKAAYDANKSCICKYNGYSFILVQYNGNPETFYFTCPNHFADAGTKGGVDNVYISVEKAPYVDGGVDWSIRFAENEIASNKVDDITSNKSSSFKYPSTKAVYDYVAAKSDLNNKQDIITDIDVIRDGASKGATALQAVPAEYVTETELNDKGYATQSWVEGKNYINAHQDISHLATKDELSGYVNVDDYSRYKTDINLQLSEKANKLELSAVAHTGSYNDLDHKPTIPSEVTESTVSGWGFTKNAGTYSKPGSGIPKSDLSSDVQTSLGKADTALQSVPSEYITETELNNKGYVNETTLTDYVKVDRFNNLSNTVNGKQDNISDLSTIRSNASNGATAYSWGNHADAGYSIAGDVEATLTDYVKVDRFNNLSNTVNGKQDKISDLDTIRSGATKGATALQAVPAEYVTESELTDKGYLTANDLSFATNSDIESLFA